MEGLFYTRKVLEVLFYWIWLHPGWTLFIIYSIFKSNHICIHKKN